jgi:hypothetical protein
MLVASYGQLPLHCEPNQEQADTRRIPESRPGLHAIVDLR